MENLIKKLEKREYLVLAGLVLFSFFINLIFAYFFYFKFHSTGFVFTIVDSFAYLVKSMEIAAGNFTPMRTHSIGWPLLAAPFFYFFGSNSIFTNMVYGISLNALIGAFAVFPTYLIAKQFLSVKKSVLAALLASLSFWLTYSDFFSEPIFTIFLLFAVYFAVKSRTEPNYIYIAAALAGFSYWIRPNGIFTLIIVLLSFWIYNRKRPLTSYWLTGLLAIIIFFAVSSPLLYQRYLHFGSPFYYGENSRYFAETYHQVWGADKADASLFTYLKNHSLAEYFNRFAINGFAKLIAAYLIISLPLTAFFLWGMAIAARDKRKWPLLITIFVFLALLTPIFGIFSTPRHLFPTIPVIAILTTIGLSDFASKIPRKRLFYFIILLISASFFVFGLIQPQYYSVLKESESALEFGRWAAKNIKGRIAISTNGKYIMMNLPDATVSGRGLFDLAAPQSRVETIYPGFFTNTDDLNQWLKKNKIDYIALDRDHEPRLTIKPVIYIKKEVPDNWELIYSDFDNQSSWRINFYKINQ